MGAVFYPIIKMSELKKVNIAFPYVVFLDGSSVPA